MDFLESDAIAEEAVSVLKKELAAIKAGELALNDRLAAVQALINESTRAQQSFEERKTLVQALRNEARERSTTCISLREEADGLKKTMKELRQNHNKPSIGSKELALVKAEVDKNVEKVKKYTTRIQKEKEAINNLQERLRSLSYDQILACYPDVSRSSEDIEHEPVGRDWQSLEEILDYNKFTKRYIAESVYLPYSLGSYPPHAVVFAPTITFNEKTGRWMPFSVSQGYDGKSYHLFVSTSSRIFYRGFYKFRRLQDHKCSDIRRAKGFDRCMQQVLDFAVSPLASTNGHRKYLENLILDDVLPLECMALQCLGFDHNLYNNLVQQYRSKWGRLWSG